MHDLRTWRHVIQVVVRHDIEQHGWLSDLKLPHLYSTVLAELAQLDGTLGLDDESRAEQIAELFEISHDRAMPVWLDASQEARENSLSIQAAAAKALAETGVATLGHRRLIDSVELSAALRLTDARKRSIFSAPRTVVDGKVVIGKRFNTRLPTWSEPASLARAEPVIRWTLTLEQRRMIRDRLGYKLDTISEKYRTMTEAEFWDWTVKRESKTWTADRLAGRKEPGESDYHATMRLQRLEPQKRIRVEGVTAARRAYAKAIGCGMTRVKRMTAGMARETILALIGSENVTPATRYGCHARPDKNGQNRPILLNQKQKTCGHSPTENVTENDVNDDLDNRDRAILSDWYLSLKGRPLKPATVRKWRERKTLDRNLFAACEYLMTDTTVWPGTFVLHAQVRMRAYQASRTENAQRERYERLSGNLIRMVSARA